MPSKPLLLSFWRGGYQCFIILILFGIFNYFFGLILELLKSSDSKMSNQCLNFAIVLFVVANVLALFYYKYSFWIISKIEIKLLGYTEDQLTVLPKTLPLGISFFTFHAISYLVDIYRKQLSGKNSLLSFLTYFFMFPHLVAGPIVRFKQVKDDIISRVPNKELFTYGFYRFILGLNKKILIANIVSVFPSMSFNYEIETVSMTSAWLGAIGYALQIYFDFSAYSDMAIGLAAMAGFKFEENFNQPYQSKSIREFWRRWHISLSSWLRDYLYIPLGGSRVKNYRIYFNLLIVFFICGLWHGAHLTFVLWGLYNGFLIVCERLYLAKFFDKLPAFFSHVYTIIAFLIGWVLFRAIDLTQAINYYKIMFGIENFNVDFSNNTELLNYIVMLLGIAIVFTKFKTFNSSNSHEYKVHNIAFVLNSILSILSVIMLFNGSANPFIYFNF